MSINSDSVDEIVKSVTIHMEAAVEQYFPVTLFLIIMVLSFDYDIQLKAIESAVPMDSFP